MSVYDEYKPFRNALRHFNLQASLADVWQYSSHFEHATPLPAGYALGKPFHVTLKASIYPWDLDIIARELILNASVGGHRDLKKWSDLSEVVNHIRRLEGVAYSDKGDEKIPIMFEVHRILQRQIPWQIKVGIGSMMRAYKLYGADAVDAIVERELGMNTKQFFLLGLAATGHLLNSPVISTDDDCGFLGISPEVSKAYFERLTCNLDDLRTNIRGHQKYDQDWIYSWNQLEATPLVRCDRHHPNQAVCPIPRHFIRRATSGIFYDLVATKGFDNPYGSSFEAYVGDVLHATCPSDRFVIREEEPYYDGKKNLKHGVDWVLSDATGHLFIEAKTKRLSLGGRIHSEPDALEGDLLSLANAIVQHYRNILEMLDGKTSWKPDGLPIYPLVLTLEDWFIFGPWVHEMLAGHVERLLATSRLPAEVIDEMPYTVVSAGDFEVVSQIIAQVGIGPLMVEKTKSETRQWIFLPFVQASYAKEMRNVKWALFEEEWNALMPDVPYA